MHRFLQVRLRVFLVIGILAAVSPGLAGRVPFDSDRWQISRGEIVTHLEKEALAGRAMLNDVVFENGVIEVDMCFDGTRCFAGIVFRMAPDGGFENFYIRPHNSKKPTALQYTPEFNGLSGWQLYNGDGFTAQATIPHEVWLHVKLEVSGTQARIFLDHADQPALVIHELKRGKSQGSIGVAGPPTGQVHFANFSYESRDDLEFEPPPKPDHPAGLITQWELSQPFRYVDVDLERHPKDQGLTELNWQTVKPEASGLLNIGRFAGLKNRQPSVAFLRTTIESEQAGFKRLNFGYSDAAVIFLNGRQLFTGVSTFRSRDATFLGVAGLFDTLVLPLNKGSNELLIAVVETFGGWGFMAQDGDYLFLADGVKPKWEITSGFNMPESAVYDSKRDVFYISNTGTYSPPGSQFISMITPDGTIKERQWVQGLARPTGLIISDDTLFAVERNHLVVIDLESATIEDRHAFPPGGFPNDVTADADGAIFVSDSRKGVIYRFADGTMTQWLSGPEVENPNGVLVHQDHLIWGNNGDGCLKSADLKTKKIETIANLNPGGIDGIALDKDGNFLVSHFNGRLFRVAQDGQATKLIDTTARGLYLCDFAYVPDQDLVVIPALRRNKLLAYELN